MAQNTITTKGVLIINGKQVESTFNELYSRTKKLQQELKKLKPGTQEFLDKATELKRVKAEFDAVRKEINATTRELEKSEGIVGKVIKSFGGLGNVFTIGASVSLASTTQELLKISDAITDVQKTSGLAQKEVEELWKEFSNFDTRTSKLELMNIAQIGGRLGITDKEQLQEFTREIDKIYVALGDSFQGGLEEVTTKVGKLKNLFDETKNTDYASALNEIGSALNELGANGTASESNITDFATRVGQLPSALKPAIDKTLGLGAALEESGIDAQIGASGFTKFIAIAGEHLPAFAQQMKITKEQATELFRTKPEEFFLRFAESTKHLQADEQIRVWDNLKLKTLEVQKTLGTAGDNADRFRELMKLSSKAMMDATSIQEEFNKKNENAAAIWQKLGNVIKNLITDGFVPDFFNWLTGIVGKITGLTSEATDGIKIFRERLLFLVKTLSVVTTAVFSYRAAVWLATQTTKQAWQQTLLYNAAQKASYTLMVGIRSIILAMRVAFSLLTFQFGTATRAMQAFNLATKLNPIGAILGVITAAVVAFKAFSKSMDETAQKQQLLSNLQNNVTSKMRNEVQQIQDLVGVIKNETNSRKDQEDALKRLQEIAPEYFKNLDIDKIKTLEGKKAIDQYIQSLDRKYRLETLNEQIGHKKDKLNEEENTRNVIDKNSSLNPLNWFRSNDDYEATYEKQLEKETASLNQRLKNGEISSKAFYNALQMRKKVLSSIYENKNQEIKILKEDIKTLEDERKKLIEEDVELVTKGNSKGAPLSVDSKKNTSDHYAQAQRELLKTQRDFIKKQQELEDEKNAIVQESLDKQLSAIETQYERKKIALQQENQDIIAQIEALNQKINLAQEKIKSKETSAQEKADAQKAIALYHQNITQKQQLIEQNNQMEIAQENTKQHQLKITREKWEIKKIEQERQNFENKITRSKIEKEWEIAQITTLSQAKEKLQKQGYQGQLSQIKTLEEAKKALRHQAEKELLESTLASLEAQKKLLSSHLQTLSGEQAQKLNEELDKLNEKIIQIKTALTNNAGQSPNPNSVKGTDAENVDILGFSAGQWEEVFNNLDTTEGRLKAVGMAMQSLAHVGSMFAQAQQQNNERELRQFASYQERRKKALAQQLNAGIITQEQYHNSLRQMEVDTANKKSELEEKQFRAEKIGRLFSAIGSTAQAVAAALTAGPVMGPILAGIVGALGAVQIGIIRSQQPPSRATYQKGGYTQGLGFADHTGHEVAGIVHAKEYVVPQWLLNEPQVANVVQWLEFRRTGKIHQLPTFEKGGHVASVSAEAPVIQPQRADNPVLMQSLHRLTDILEKIDSQGIDAFILADAQNGKKMYQAIKKYKKLEEKVAK